MKSSIKQFRGISYSKRWLLLFLLVAASGPFALFLVIRFPRHVGQFLLGGTWVLLLAGLTFATLFVMYRYRRVRGYAAKKEVERYSLAYWLWFTAIGVLGAFGALAVALGVLYFFGVQRWALATFAGLLAGGVFGLLGVVAALHMLSASYRGVLTICWLSPAPDGIANLGQRLQATMFLGERYQWAKKQKPQAFRTIADMSEMEAVWGLDIPREIDLRGHLGREVRNRGLALGGMVGMVFVLTYFLLLVHLIPQPDPSTVFFPDFPSPHRAVNQGTPSVVAQHPLENEGNQGEADRGQDRGTATAQPGEGTAQPGEGTAQPGEGTPQPGNGTAQPGEGTAQPGEGTAQPGEKSTPKPEGGTAQPGNGTAQPGKGTAQPGEGTPQPGNGTAQPGGGTARPGGGTAQPGEGTPQPGNGTAQPGGGTAQPGEGGGTSESDEGGHNGDKGGLTKRPNAGSTPPRLAAPMPPAFVPPPSGRIVEIELGEMPGFEGEEEAERGVAEEPTQGKPYQSPQDRFATQQTSTLTQPRQFLPNWLRVLFWKFFYRGRVSNGG